MSAMKIDPVTFNVLSHAFRNLATEMGAVMVKSAYSSIVREAKDASTCLLDAEGRVVAQAQMIPMHMNSLASAFDFLRARFTLAEIGADEALITNNPYHNGQHLNDVLLFVPVFHDGA
jgi:N-methylhydantoinase B